ncbi:MAG: helix-turn-helix domain-containing protein [Deltaproteobacteria bacterium]|nr:helix-turn-helix domain-containing protein [Deltaproteobacteria bacterium]
MTQHMEPELLTIAELARNLDLPESTTRYYCNRFAEHLPSVGEGRRRRFKPEALDVLRTIAETMRRDKNAYAVDLALRGTVPSVPVAPVQHDLPFAPSGALAGQMLSMMESQTKALQDIAHAMNVFADRLTLAPVAAPSPEENAPAKTPSPADDNALREEIATLREQIRASEDVHQNDLEQLRKWLSRLGEALSSK